MRAVPSFCASLFMTNDSIADGAGFGKVRRAQPDIGFGRGSAEPLIKVPQKADSAGYAPDPRRGPVRALHVPPGFAKVRQG